MKLKYQSEIDLLSPSFDGFSDIDNKPAFRWVFADINHPNNFLPIPKTNPSRVYTDFKDWALSFFISKKQAKDRLLHLTSNSAKLYKKLGTHTAEGIINKIDGLCEDECDSDGHFNHFEYEGTDFYKNERFVIVETIIVV
jgi:hypothetical protein